MYERTRDEGFGDEPKRRIMVGTYALSAGYYDAFYGQAQKVRTVIKREHDALFETFDALVSPTSPTVAFPLGARTADPIAMYLSDLLTIPSCMAGLPGLEHPVRPVGGTAGRPAADRAAVRREHAVPHRPRARAGDRLRRRSGAAAMSDWELVCGLEVHCHLKTSTKMFCRCALEYGAGENTHTCPVCLAHPGALPVPNGRAIEMTILLGLALDCEIAEHAVFARKNYFYPDLPKGYQISQYEAPLCGPRRVRRADRRRRPRDRDRARAPRGGRREDRPRRRRDRPLGRRRLLARRLQPRRHAAARDRRAPDLRSADEAMWFLRLLRQTIAELGVSDAEMEKGTLRADVNVSVRKRGEEGSGRAGRSRT